jgi:beta-lactamase class A
LVAAVQPSSEALAEIAARSAERGSVSIWAGPTSGPPWFAFRDDAEHYACSTIKVPLVLAVYREADAGRLELDRTVLVHDDFASQQPGRRFTMNRGEDDDQEPWKRLGQRVALRWLACRAIVRSSNLATNLLLEAVGLGPVADVLAECGVTSTVMTRGIEDPAAVATGSSNVVTARDLASVFQAIAGGGIASPAALMEVRGLLGAQQWNDGIPAGLPAGVRVEHKTGWVEGISHDVGIVHPVDRVPYILAVCTTTGLPEGDGSRLIADIAAASWRDLAVPV